jgi:hypothetical protein
MTSYVVTAWCDRPFFAQCRVEAATAEEALTLARLAVLSVPAKECDDGYFWDEWRVDTEQIDAVLVHLDHSARLRAAALPLLDACRLVVARWEHGDLAEAARACQDAIALATSESSLNPRKPIVIEVHGGVVQDVLNVPPGYRYEVVDYDDLDDADDAGRTA